MAVTPPSTGRAAPGHRPGGAVAYVDDADGRPTAAGRTATARPMPLPPLVTSARVPREPFAAGLHAVPLESYSS